MTIRDLDRDKETGEYQFPDAALMQRVRAALAKQSGIPIQRLLQEQEVRIPPALPETVWRRIPSQTNGQRAQQHIRAKPTASGGSGRQLPQRTDPQSEQERDKVPETPQLHPAPRSGANGRRRYRVS
jgi:hypothetical protein